MKRVVLIMGLAVFCMTSYLSSASALTVKLDPASVSLPAVGGKFTINVQIEDVVDLGGFQFDIDYDPTIVTIQNAAAVVLGPFLASTGNTASPLGPTIDNVGGNVTFGGFSFGANPGPSGTGVLASIEFTVQSQTAGLLDLTNVQVTDIEATVLPVTTVGDCSLTVQPLPPPPPPEVSLLYFPHIASILGWETEIGVVNDSNNDFNGQLHVYDSLGSEVSAGMHIALGPHARQEIVVGQAFINPSDIAYAVLNSETDSAKGYVKFSYQGKDRAAIPAVRYVTTGPIHVPHIASTSDWWTGIALLNTTSSQKEITIEFDRGDFINITLAANAHAAFTVRQFFGGEEQPDIHSAVINNANGVIGLQVFGCSSGCNYIEGIVLTDTTSTHVYYPHVANDAAWWTGIVAYNASALPSDLTINPYAADGSLLAPQTVVVNGHDKYVGSADALGLPDETAWIEIAAANPLAGCELIGSTDGKELAGYRYSGGGEKQGVLLKIEKNGWSGIVFVNTEDKPATVQLTAYSDDGGIVANATLDLPAHAKEVGLVQDLFAGADIADATYIAYSSTTNTVGSQFNGSSDGTMLDGLPGM